MVEGINLVNEVTVLREQIAEIERIVADPFHDEKMTDAVREVMLLAAYGVATADIAKRVGKTVPAVNSLLMRGLNRLNLTKRQLPKYVLGKIEKVLEE